MNQINFSHNWNDKLHNKIFTTIRRRTPEKWRYYIDNLDTIFEVVLNDEFIGKARLVTMRETTLQKIITNSPELLCVDTGFSCLVKICDTFRTFGATKDVLILTFENIESNDILDT